MQISKYLIATLREAPAEAEIISHQLMLRAGMIRRIASGIYTWLPMGLRVLRKVEAIVRRVAGINMGQNYCASRTGTSEIFAWALHMKKSLPT